MSDPKAKMRVATFVISCLAAAAIIEGLVWWKLLLPVDPRFKEWVEVYGSLGPIIVAALVGYVGFLQHMNTKTTAHRQLQLQREQVRLALFDRRYAIYRRFRDVQAELTREGRCSRDTALEATEISLDAKFLFNDETEEFLERFQKTAWDMHSWPSRHKAALIDDHAGVKSLIAEHEASLKELSDSYKYGDPIFERAMGVRL